MKTVVISFICILAGISLAFIAPLVPYAFTKYVAIAIIAAFDSIIGAWASYTKKTFDFNVFISGFFVNSVIAIFLTLIGESLNVDIYLAAIFVFVFRMFNNLSIIRRFFLDELSKKKVNNK